MINTNAKKQKGITLIALIITIIVLLILAGVTIAMLRGDNGIIKNATKAQSSNAYSYAEEKMKLANTTVRTQIETEILTNSSYNAKSRENLLKLVNLVRNDLEMSQIDTVENLEAYNQIAEGKWQVSVNPYVGKIIITCIDSNISTSSGAKEDGKAVGVILLKEGQSTEFEFNKNELDDTNYAIVSTTIDGTNTEKAFLLSQDIKLYQFFSYAKNATIKYNGNNVLNISELSIGDWILKYDRTANEITVSATEPANSENYEIKHIKIIGDSYSKNIPDLTGNANHNLTFKNGACIKKDSSGKYYLSFDGNDDYAQISKLEETINWTGGFTAEFEAEWNAFNDWSRIFDFGNGSSNDNILVANQTTNNKILLSVYHGSSGNDFPIVSITANQKNMYQIEYKKNSSSNDYTVTTKINDSEVDSKNYGMIARNLERTNNYLGKSNWENDKYFKGKIYSLKITQANGEVILWYNVNEWLDLSGEQL